MAPEQFQGRAAVQSDLYGLAATVVHVLSHVPPSELPQEGLKLDFRGSIKASDGTADWLDRMLEPDPRHRFASARDALDAFRRRNDAQVQRAAALSFTRVSDTPPAGSRIEVVAGGTDLDLTLPGRGLGVGSLGRAGFATFWLLFVAIWTAGAARGSGVFALFSIPFWVVGTAMMATALFSMFGKTKVHIGRDQFVLSKTFLGVGLRHTGETKDLAGASEGASTMRVNDQLIQHCILREGAREITFGSSLTQPEREWVVARINAHLERQDAAAPRWTSSSGRSER
jgi:hypothetical protein